MSQTKQITNYALHTFLEQIEEAILEGFRIHKTPATYAKLIGGRYTVTMVKPTEIVVDVVKQLEVDPVEIEITASVIPDNGTPEPDVTAEPVAKPTTRGRKKADEA